MSSIVIAGGSAAGSFAALLLARAGHRVVVLDKDRARDDGAGRGGRLGLYRRPDEVSTDPDVVACTREALRRHQGAPPEAQPTREQLLAALAR